MTAVLALIGPVPTASMMISASRPFLAPGMARGAVTGAVPVRVAIPPVLVRIREEVYTIDNSALSSYKSSR